MEDFTWYDRGYDDYYRGNKCPFYLIGKNRREWWSGWRAADLYEKQRFDNYEKQRFDRVMDRD